MTNDRSKKNGSFICGVVEGFYGRPWTCNQRKELFKRLGEFKLDTFMYAPKDDAKHRSKWRQLYNDQELGEMKSLIDEAKRNNINFYYSLSPGLDMIYSNQDELDRLFKKYDQLRNIGCESFAILFDDIEPAISNKDKESFNDYATAQIYVTNAVYEHLKRPKFLFCPTEYCESRASPDVINSNYLNSIGVGLDQGIDIMWSGSRVISRFITVESIETLTKAIRRPPVIWENLHANDYDRRRVFMGPYSGRSTEMISKLRGVLSNPNCEYEANYIALHTLGQWSRCSNDTSSDRTNSESEITPVYDPNKALMSALREWLPKVLERRYPLTDVNSNEQQMKSWKDDEDARGQLGFEVSGDKPLLDTNESESVDMVHEGTSTFVMTTVQDENSKNGMETAESSSRSANNNSNSCDSCFMQEDVIENEDAQDLEKMSNPLTNVNGEDVSSNSSILRVAPFRQPVLDLEKLALLVDLYYLPFEHGKRGNTLLDDIKWLQEHSDSLISKNIRDQKQHQGASYKEVDKRSVNEDRDETKMNDGEDEEEKEEEEGEENMDEEEDNSEEHEMDCEIISTWLDRAKKCSELCISVGRLVNTLIYECPNKLLIIELYPYLTEMRDMMGLLLDYIKFLRFRTSASDKFYYPPCNSNGGNDSSKASKDQPQLQAPICDDEPWAHRGGLIGDVQRLLF